jgi:hypothetical protein
MFIEIGSLIKSIKYNMHKYNKYLFKEEDDRQLKSTQPQNISLYEGYHILKRLSGLERFEISQLYRYRDPSDKHSQICNSWVER